MHFKRVFLTHVGFTAQVTATLCISHVIKRDTTKGLQSLMQDVGDQGQVAQGTAQNPSEGQLFVVTFPHGIRMLSDVGISS